MKRQPKSDNATEGAKNPNLDKNSPTWPRFDEYFESEWQRKGIRMELAEAGFDLPKLGRWAVLAVDPKIKETVQTKGPRGRQFTRLLERAIKGYGCAIEAYKMYSNMPDTTPDLLRSKKTYLELIEQNKRLNEVAQGFLERALASRTFTSDRLGKSWNVLHLVKMHHELRTLSAWNETKIMGAITAIVEAAHFALKKPIPPDLRRLLQKAIAAAEANPANRTIFELARSGVGEPDLRNRTASKSANPSDTDN
jgi:hypothetical protein